MKNNLEFYPRLVLFSPLGNSDPIRGNYDGAFLHILRYMKPQKAYLYKTEEIAVFSSHDVSICGNDRYNILGGRVCPSCEIIDVSPEEKISEPQKFLFYHPFENIIKRIYAENPDAAILLNISSGTPAEKATLQVLSMFLDLPLFPVQVVTPAKAANTSKPVGLIFDIEAEWNNLMDNDEELTAGRRCSVVPPSQPEVSLFTRFAAAHLTEDYDYRAAYNVLDEANVDAPAAKELLLAACDRLELKNTKLHGCNLLPIETSGAMEICEYLLYLQVKARRGETSEFARSVSPVLTELFRNYLLNLMQIDVRQLCSLRSGVYWITNETLSAAGNIRLGDHVSGQSYYDLYHQTYPDLRNTPLSFAMLLPLINFFCEQKNWQKDRDEIKKLRDFEENVRNKAAHQIAGLSETDLKAQFGFTTEEIIALLRKYFEKSFTDLCKNKKDTMWNSYEDMNRKIVKLLMA